MDYVLEESHHHMNNQFQPLYFAVRISSKSSEQAINNGAITDKIIIYNIDFIIFSYCRLLLDKLFIYSSKGIVTISSGFAFDVVFIIPYQEPLNLTSLSLASFPLR